MAIAELHQALQRSPHLTIALYWLGEVERAQGHMQRALRLLQASAEQAPRQAGILLKYGEILLPLGHTKKAAQILRHCLALNQNNSRAHYLLGQAYLRSGRRTAAKAQFQAATRLNNHALLEQKEAAWGVRIQRELRQHASAQALALTAQALRRDPHSARFTEYRAIALTELGHASQARIDFTQALRLSAGDPEIHFNFGIALWQAGHAAAAIQQFRDTLRVEPDHGPAHCALALALLRSGQRRQGRRELRQARALGACRAPVAP